MKIENTQIFGFQAAFRGMRNARSSWDKADSIFQELDLSLVNCPHDAPEAPTLGPNDLHLARKLVLSNPADSKFTRQIVVWTDMTLPRYLWQEFDTYKVGTVRNSCSTIPTELKKHEFTIDMFEEEGRMGGDTAILIYYLQYLNCLINDECKNAGLVGVARRIKKLLPESYLQKATVMLNYQVLRTMYFQRRTHYLPEWHKICEWIESLPYASDLITIEKKVKKHAEPSRTEEN